MSDLTRSVPAPQAARIEARYRRRASVIGSILKWPAIGALIGVGALVVGSVAGPSIAETLGMSAGEGFARGMAEAQAAIQRQLSISGWGTYRRR